MVQLFNLNNHIIDTSKYGNLLHEPQNPKTPSRDLYFNE